MKRGRIILGSIIGVITISVVTSLAWFTDNDNKANSLTGSVKITTDESFTPPESWDGSEYEKIVEIKNTGKSDALVRASLVPRWVDEKGNPFSGDVSIVNFTPQNPENWTKGSDGYYYYNEILKRDEKTKPLLEGVSLDLVSLSTDEKKLYEGKKLIVDVNSEAVQATEEAFKATWTTIDEHIKTMLENLCSK